MKVLIFNDSPKGNKSDTLHLTKAFLEGMKTATTIEETIINVNEKKSIIVKGALLVRSTMVSVSKMMI